MAKTYKLILLALLFAWAPVFASAATMSISPTSGTGQVGDYITVRIVVSGNTPLNAVSADVLFPPSIFSIQSISKNGSVLNFWVTEPTFKKSTGVVHLEGVALNGFQGSSATVLTVTVKAIAAGSGKVSFQTGQILANDGQGTDVTGALSGSTFVIKEATTQPAVESPVPEPEQVVEPTQIFKTPEITSGEKYGAPSIVGTSGYVKAPVVITFLAENGTKVFVAGDADVDGSFNVIIPNSLKRGSYSVSAVMIKQDGTHSDTSNTISIQVGNLLSDIPKWIFILLAFLVLFILYLLLRVSHHLGRNKNTSRHLQRKTDDAEKIIHKSFEILRDDIHQYEHEELSVSDHKIIAEIKKDINDAEKVITKEVKDIELI